MSYGTTLRGVATLLDWWKSLSSTEAWVLGTALLLVLIYVVRCVRHKPKYNAPAVVEPEPEVFDEYQFEGDSFVWVTFSGGGTRSAALAWKVLETLREIPFPKIVDGRREVSTLADEIDVISGISGGSFAAAAWCLSPESLAGFRQRVLERNLERGIRRRLLHPRQLGRLLSPRYNRINVAAELYDDEIFDRATFSDLPQRPDLRIHGTHLALGAAFPFTPETFRLIGSDLSGYPIGYACAASSAFPILLSPMTLLNHGDTLSLAQLAERDRHTFTRLQRNALDDVESDLQRVFHEYLNDKANGYVHLADGGLVDNQGLQSVIDAFSEGGLIGSRLNRGDPSLKRLIFINVNAGTRPDDCSGSHAAPPGVTEVMEYTMVASMDVLSAKRWIRIRDLCTERYNRSKNEEGKHKVKYFGMEEPYAIEVSFRKILDDELRKRCDAIATRFTLRREDLATIDDVAPRLIREDLHMQRLGSALREEFVDTPEAT